MAAEARRNGSAYLKVCRPPEPLWNPRLREAATTLVAMSGRQCNLEKLKRKILKLLKKVVSLQN